jgi:AAA domain, putative AbiEii toxin, Type IV TA system
MGKLSDFLPIERLVLPELGELVCNGLILVVGPNSSGKSQLLRDIYHRIAGEPRVSVVASEIKIKKHEYEPLVECLKKEGVLESYYADDGSERIRSRTTYGTGEAAPEIQPHQSQQWHSVYQDDEQVARKRRSEYLNYFGKFLVTQLFLERRLTSLQATSVIDFQNQAPQQDLHALYLNSEARKALMNEIRSSFSKAIWPDTSRGNVICIRVSSENDIPSAEDRLDPMRMTKYRQIETEGDGFKSYVATCVSLLLSRRPVCLIDEPELCLHPPQAYNLGKFIGRIGEKNEGVTFVSTHSSHVLRGAIQDASSVQIIRLTRNGEEFSAHLVPSLILKEALKKPTVRSESVLDGIFSQAVVIVESDTDRTVYQAAWESVSSEFNSEVHFSPVGGIGGIADSVVLYKALKIPVAVIADLDLLTNIDAITRVLSSLVGPDVAAVIIKEANEVSLKIKLIPPVCTPDVVLKELKELQEHNMSWSGNDDLLIRKRLTLLSADLDRMTRLKTGGLHAMPSDLSLRMQALLESLRGYGLFLVPLGELESWLDGQGVQASRKKKWAWANEAATLIRSKGAQENDIWDFTRKVGKYLFP